MQYRIYNTEKFLLFSLEKDNMKSVLSQFSDIPEENIEFAKVNKTNQLNKINCFD